MSAEAVVETRQLSKRFGDLLAVDGLSMKVTKGEVYGFLGPNGAGKTTTLKMLMGLTHPSGGEMLVDGRRVDREAVAIRKNIGYLPERVAFYDNLTPVQTLNFFCELKGADPSVVGGLLEDVGLADAADRKVGTFSKGMTQLLGVAQAMIGEPPLYIFDEPTSGLDPRWVKVVRDKIKALNEKGATVLFSSHILSEVQALSHRVAVIDKGRLVAEDTVAGLNRRLELRPRIELHIPGLGGKVPAQVLGVPGVEGATADGDRLLVTCDGEVRAAVVLALNKAGMEMTDIRTSEPTLEEAFVKLVSDKGGAA